MDKDIVIGDLDCASYTYAMFPAINLITNESIVFIVNWNSIYVSNQKRLTWKGRAFVSAQDCKPLLVYGFYARPTTRWVRNILLWRIQPDKLIQNSYLERYNWTVCYNWLNQHLFETIDKMNDFTTRWLWEYNNSSSNMGIGRVTSTKKLKQVV